MISADFHTHTCFSSDSEAKIEDMLDKAVEKGLKTYCITDHYDYMFPQKYKDSFTFSLDDYFDELLRLREKYDKKLDVRIGIEEGYRSEKDIKDEVRMFYSKLADKYDFDFIIGSTHILRGMDPYYKEYWDGVTKEEGLKEYFLSVLDNCENYDNFDVYGHIDYIARVIPGTDKDYNTSDYMDIIDEILKKLIKNGRGIEINTAGIKYGLKFAHPKPEIIKRYRKLGGSIITVGSDAHRPEHIAYAFDTIPELLKECGFDYYTVFKRRKPEFIKI